MGFKLHDFQALDYTISTSCKLLRTVTMFNLYIKMQLIYICRNVCAL